jgi:uncharacterized protein (TIGR00725 family)
MKKNSKKMIVGVIGGIGSEFSINVIEKAERLGAVVAKNGGTVITSGGSGLQYHIGRGAINEGGELLAITPGANKDEHENLYKMPTDGATVFCYSGMGTVLSNQMILRSCDMLLVLGGEAWAHLRDSVGLDSAPRVLGCLVTDGYHSESHEMLAKDIGPDVHVIFHSDPDHIMTSMIAEQEFFKEK